MSISLNLTKGERVDLTKGTNIKQIKVCLGWDVGNNFDLDASAFLLDKNGKLVTGADLVYFNALKHPSGSVIHSGDDRTGAGDVTHNNDKEIISVDLSKIPQDKEKIVFAATIYDAQARRQNFGQVSNAFIRVVNSDNSAEIMKFDLTENFSIATSMIVAEIYRNNGEWKFAAIGNAQSGGLKELIEKYGLNI